MQDKQEGSVVAVAMRVEGKSGEDVGQYGTVIQVIGNEVLVLLPSGYIWKGPINATYDYQEGLT